MWRSLALIEELSSVIKISSKRYLVYLKEDGMTLPYENGKGREIWPDGKFPGYPEPGESLESDNIDGYKWNSMPLVELFVSHESQTSPKKAQFLIDSGATSKAQWSLHLKEVVLEIGKGDIETRYAQNGEPARMTCKISNDTSDKQLSDRFEGIENKKWTRTIIEASLRVKHRYKGAMKGRVSPRENSVLGLPWMLDIKPLFVFKDPPDITNRLVIRFPEDGIGRYVVLLKNPTSKKVERVPVSIDTGAPFSTFPEKLLKKLGLREKGSKKIFTWFDYENRALYDAEYCNVPHESTVEWSCRNKDVGITGRSKSWGLLGMDFLLRVKPLIIYGNKKIPGQMRNVDYLEKNVMESDEDQFNILKNEIDQIPQT